MIDRYYNKYIIVCDICLCKSDNEFETFDEAVESKRQEGYISKKENGNWLDICKDCRK